MSTWEDYDRLRDEIGDLKRKISSIRRQIDEKDRRCQEMRTELSGGINATAEAQSDSLDETTAEDDGPPSTTEIPQYIADTALFVKTLARAATAEDVAAYFNIDSSSASARLSKAHTYYHLLRRAGRGLYLPIEGGSMQP